MPRGRPEFGRSADSTRPTPASVGRLATRAGIVVLVTALPLVLVTFLLVLLGAPSVGAGLDAVGAATTGPLTAGGGVGWLLHVGVLGVLAGAWILGLGQVLVGLYD